MMLLLLQCRFQPLKGFGLVLSSADLGLGKVLVTVIGRIGIC